MKCTKIIALALAALMVLPLFSCNAEVEEKLTDDPGSVSVESESTTAETEPAETEPTLKLPELNYEDATFTIYGDKYVMNNYYTMYYDEEGADVVGDAAYRRNMAVEELLGVKIRYADVTNDEGNVLSASILAGDGVYDLASMMNTNMAPIIYKGQLYDLTNFPLIDIENPWYIKYVNEQIEMGGSRFAACGYFDMATFARTCIVFFSTKLAEDNSLGNLYELVEKNEWTYDKMLELGEKCYNDLNGDSVMSPETDVFGISGGFNMNGMLITTTGYRFAEKTSESAVATGITDDLINFNELLCRMNIAPYYYNCYPQGGTNNFNTAYSVFSEDRVLFLIQDISNSQTFAEKMDDYGILPAPKYTTDQPAYTSFCRPGWTAIPIDVKDTERASAVLEALNYTSRDTVLPAYCEKALSMKYASSEDASRIVNMIFENVACDFVQGWYNILKLSPNLHNSIGYMEDYASWFKSIEESFNVKMAEIFTTLAKFQADQKVSG